MTNKTAIINKPDDIQILDLPVREPANDEVLVNVKFTALCGSDMKLYHGSYTAPHKYPIVIGHEWVGEIVKVGASAEARFSVGDIVTGDCSLYCNTCKFCTSGRKNHCVSIEKKGITVDGSCSQFNIVNQQHIYKCEKLPDLKALALVEPLSVTVEAVVNRIPAEEFRTIESALIIGCGGIGALAIFMLIEQGVKQITIVDVAEDKLAIVRSFGFDQVQALQAKILPVYIAEGKQFDLIIEASGHETSLGNAINLASPQGRIVCVGHQKKMEVDLPLIMKKSLTLISSIGSTGGFELAAKIVAKHFNNVNKLITRIIKIDDLPATLSQNKNFSSDIKVLINLNQS